MHLFEVAQVIEEVVRKEDFWKKEENVPVLREMLQMAFHAKRPLIYFETEIPEFRSLFSSISGQLHKIISVTKCFYIGEGGDETLFIQDTLTSLENELVILLIRIMYRLEFTVVRRELSQLDRQLFFKLINAEHPLILYEVMNLLSLCGDKGKTSLEVVGDLYEVVRTMHGDMDLNLLNPQIPVSKEPFSLQIYSDENSLKTYTIQEQESLFQFFQRICSEEKNYSYYSKYRLNLWTNIRLLNGLKNETSRQQWITVRCKAFQLCCVANYQKLPGFYDEVFEALQHNLLETYSKNMISELLCLIKCYCMIKFELPSALIMEYGTFAEGNHPLLNIIQVVKQVLQEPELDMESLSIIQSFSSLLFTFGFINVSKISDVFFKNLDVILPPFWNQREIFIYDLFYVAYQIFCKNTSVKFPKSFITYMIQHISKFFQKMSTDSGATFITEHVLEFNIIKEFLKHLDNLLEKPEIEEVVLDCLAENPEFFTNLHGLLLHISHADIRDFLYQVFLFLKMVLRTRSSFKDTLVNSNFIKTLIQTTVETKDAYFLYKAWSFATLFLPYDSIFDMLRNKDTFFSFISIYCVHGYDLEREQVPSEEIISLFAHEKTKQQNTIQKLFANYCKEQFAFFKGVSFFCKKMSGDQSLIHHQFVNLLELITSLLTTDKSLVELLFENDEHFDIMKNIMATYMFETSVESHIPAIYICSKEIIRNTVLGPKYLTELCHFWEQLESSLSSTKEDILSVWFTAANVSSCLLVHIDQLPSISPNLISRLVKFLVTIESAATVEASKYLYTKVHLLKLEDTSGIPNSSIIDSVAFNSIIIQIFQCITLGKQAIVEKMVTTAFSTRFVHLYAIWFQQLLSNDFSKEELWSPLFETFVYHVMFMDCNFENQNRLQFIIPFLTQTSFLDTLLSTVKKHCENITKSFEFKSQLQIKAFEEYAITIIRLLLFFFSNEDGEWPEDTTTVHYGVVFTMLKVVKQLMMVDNAWKKSENLQSYLVTFHCNLFSELSTLMESVEEEDELMEALGIELEYPLLDECTKTAGIIAAHATEIASANSTKDKLDVYKLCSCAADIGAINIMIHSFSNLLELAKETKVSDHQRLEHLFVLLNNILPVWKRFDFKVASRICKLHYGAFVLECFKNSVEKPDASFFNSIAKHVVLMIDHTFGVRDMDLKDMKKLYSDDFFSKKEKIALFAFFKDCFAQIKSGTLNGDDIIELLIILTCKMVGTSVSSLEWLHKNFMKPIEFVELIISLPSKFYSKGLVYNFSLALTLLMEDKDTIHFYMYNLFGKVKSISEALKVVPKKCFYQDFDMLLHALSVLKHVHPFPQAEDKPRAFATQTVKHMMKLILQWKPFSKAHQCNDHLLDRNHLLFLLGKFVRFYGLGKVVLDNTVFMDHCFECLQSTHYSLAETNNLKPAQNWSKNALNQIQMIFQLFGTIYEQHTILFLELFKIKMEEFGSKDMASLYNLSQWLWNIYHDVASKFLLTTHLIQVGMDTWIINWLLKNGMHRLQYFDVSKTVHALLLILLQMIQNEEHVFSFFAPTPQQVQAVYIDHYTNLFEAYEMSHKQEATVSAEPIAKVKTTLSTAQSNSQGQEEKQRTEHMELDTSCLLPAIEDSEDFLHDFFDTKEEDPVANQYFDVIAEELVNDLHEDTINQIIEYCEENVSVLHQRDKRENAMRKRRRMEVIEEDKKPTTRNTRSGNKKAKKDETKQEQEQKTTQKPSEKLAKVFEQIVVPLWYFPHFEIEYRKIMKQFLKHQTASSKCYSLIDRVIMQRNLSNCTSLQKTHQLIVQPYDLPVKNIVPKEVFYFCVHLFYDLYSHLEPFIHTNCFDVKQCIQVIDTQFLTPISQPSVVFEILLYVYKILETITRKIPPLTAKCKSFLNTEFWNRLDACIMKNSTEMNSNGFGRVFHFWLCRWTDTFCLMNCSFTLEWISKWICLYGKLTSDLLNQSLEQVPLLLLSKLQLLLKSYQRIQKVNKEPLFNSTTLLKEYSLDRLWEALDKQLIKMNQANTQDNKQMNSICMILDTIATFYSIFHTPASSTVDGVEPSSAMHRTDKLSKMKANFTPTPSLPWHPQLSKLAKFIESHNKKWIQPALQHDQSLYWNTICLLQMHNDLFDFEQKRKYFYANLHKQLSHAEAQTTLLSIDRESLLETSMDPLLNLSAAQLKQNIRVEFEGEEGYDAGGLKREWFTCLCNSLFSQELGLFIPTVNQSTFQPNPLSGAMTDHLNYFFACGRFVALAIFNRVLLDAYFTRSFYKHILGKDLHYKDMETVDTQFYNNLKWLYENEDGDVENELDLTFSLDVDSFDTTAMKPVRKLVELKPNGNNIKVTNQNKLEFIKLVTEYKMTTVIEQQLQHFLKGFFQIIPKELITVFNEQELELLISGVPTIDIEDWRKNTEYVNYSENSIQIQWFWNVLRAMTSSELSQFLMFCTGSSKVPLDGFKNLMGSQGTVKRFNIVKDAGSNDRLPTSHTCFNQLVLPAYSSEEELKEKLVTACTYGYFGFELV